MSIPQTWASTKLGASTKLEHPPNLSIHQTWASTKLEHPPNLSIYQTWASTKLEHLPNLSIHQTWASTKLEHSPNLSILQTWASPKLEHPPNLSIHQNLSINQTWASTKLVIVFSFLYQVDSFRAFQILFCHVNRLVLQSLLCCYCIGSFFTVLICIARLTCSKSWRFILFVILLFVFEKLVFNLHDQ